MAMADEYVYKISSRYLQKWLSYDMLKTTKFALFRYFYFYSLRKFDLKACIAVAYHDFFFWGGWPFYRMTWDDLDLYYVQAEC